MPTITLPVKSSATWIIVHLTTKTHASKVAVVAHLHRSTVTLVPSNQNTTPLQIRKTSERESTDRGTLDNQACPKHVQHARLVLPTVRNNAGNEPIELAAQKAETALQKESCPFPAATATPRARRVPLAKSLSCCQNHPNSLQLQPVLHSRPNRVKNHVLLTEFPSPPCIPPTAPR